MWSAGRMCDIVVDRIRQHCRSHEVRHLHYRSAGRMQFSGSSVLAALALVAGCGGPDTSPTSSSQMSGACRNHASSVTATTTRTFAGQSPNVDTVHITTSHNTATNQLSGTAAGSSNNGSCSRSGSWSTNYGSVADFVDEVSVIPPRTRWTSQSGTAMLSGPAPPCLNRTVAPTTTNAFDSQGRLTNDVSTGGIGFPLLTTAVEATVVYPSWDFLGRPTSFSLSGGVRAVFYDDAARTLSIYNPGAFTTSVDAFDSNGNLVLSESVVRYPPGNPVNPRGGIAETIETVFVIEATTRVCDRNP